MSSKDVRKSTDGCAFEVQLDDRPTTPGNAPPECITKHKTKPVSPRDIEEKQAQADARRKAYIEARLKRIQEVDQEHEKLSKTFSSLVEQDAKRKGLPGTEHIRAMSRKEASDAIRYVARKMERMNNTIKNSVAEPE